MSTAFLQSDPIEELVYVEQPDGYKERKVCKLLRSLYGLKQAPRNRQRTLVRRVAGPGFELVASDADSCLFIKQTADGPVLLLAYVDDIKTFGRRGSAELGKLETALCDTFDMKRLPDGSAFFLSA